MRQNGFLKLSLFLMLIGILTSCSNQNTNLKNKVNQTAENIAAKNNFQKQLIKTNAFKLTSFQKCLSTSNVNVDNLKANKTITIYIEGDGRTWITRAQLSDNPTPKNPLALKLAVLDNSANVAYLARPCQYTSLALEPACNPLVWSDQRFSETVIRSMNEAIETLKQTSKSKKIHLVGFSGGGTVALLIAARRNDIVSIRTVAGDLNPIALSQYHHTSPLTGSLNPMSVTQKLISIPQQHFAGEKDKTVPPFISEAFVNHMKTLGNPCVSQITIKEATHQQGWEENWPRLLQKPFLCVKNNV